MADGETVAAALPSGVGGLAIILGLRQGRAEGARACWSPSSPAIAAVVAFDLGSRGRVAGRRAAPGLPARSPCRASGSPTSALLVAGALGITLVSLTDTISTSSAFAARTGQEVDANQEMIGIGTANLAAGLFQGFPVSTSGSRTAVAEQAGRQDAS